MATLGLDLAAGAQLAAAERYGDWYRDPWNWIEISPSNAEGLDAEADLQIKRESDGGYHLSLPPFFHLIEVPKTRLGLRPAVVQDPVSRLAYLAATSAGLQVLHRDLPEWVYGWRMRDGKTLEGGGPEWARYVASLPSGQEDGWGLLTDVTSFFASVRPQLVSEVVYRKLGRVTAAHVIHDVVRAHDSLSTRSGLPQRSFASAALAHAVLQPLDDALAAGSQQKGVKAVRRWMDDVSAEGDEGALFSLLVVLQERARQLGLELNASKTHLSPVEDTALQLQLEDLREIEIPMAIVAGGAYEEPSYEPDVDALKRLEDTLLRQPMSVPRTVARAVLVTLAKTGLHERYEEWCGIARHLPHAADALGRLLRSVGDADDALWRPLGEWFDGYQRSPWGRMDWVASQYALAFPAESLPTSVRDVLRTWLSESDNLQHLAIAVQRLCTTEPAVGRSLIRTRVDRVSDPLVIRIFALGLLLAGDDRRSVQALLQRDQRNRLLLRHLTKCGWTPPQVATDFDISG